MLSGVPEQEIVVPIAVSMSVGGGRARAVWLNILGGVDVRGRSTTSTAGPAAS